jgi:phosphoserine phosphatase RsbX
MTASTTGKVNFVEYGFAVASVDGQQESGDTHVLQYGEDSALIAVIDGIGHGDSAAAAAQIAAEVIRSHRAESLETVAQIA